MNGQGHLWGPDLIGDYGDAASSHNKSLSIHRWAKWIAGFSGEFARSAILRHLPSMESRDTTLTVLDPFAGVGTTLIEASRLGLNTIGFEINPFAAMVCRVKMGAADIELDELRGGVEGYDSFMASIADSVPHSLPPAGFKSRIPFFSPAVERKVLFTLDYINSLPSKSKEFFNVALASVMVEFSNYTYEPSLGSRPGAGKPIVHDADVRRVVLAKLRDMIEDIADFQGKTAFTDRKPTWQIHQCSFFEAEELIGAESADLMVTSPPYMNNYHYVRNSRPQLFWSGLVQSAPELKRLEYDNFGKFWQTVRSSAPISLTPELPELEKEISEIRLINGHKGVYGGNGWANYIASYMNDLDTFCQKLTVVLKPGGIAVVVVGNSIVQGREIKVEERMREIAELNGLSVLEVAKLRERVGSSIINSGARLQTKSKSALYDAAIVLRRPR